MADIFNFPILSSGKVLLALLNKYDRPKAGMVDISWYSEPKIETPNKTISIDNTRTPGGGTVFSMTRREQVKMTITLNDFNEENMGLLLGSSKNRVAVTTLTDFDVVFYKGINPLNGIIDTSKPIVVKNTDTFQRDVDYYADSSGIIIPDEGALAPLDTGTGIPLKVTATLKEVTEFQLYTFPSRSYQMRLATINEAVENTEEIYDYWKVKFSGATEFQPMGHTDKFGNVKLEGFIMPVPSQIVQPGDSAYGKVYREYRAE